MLENMVETKSWKVSRGLAKCNRCRLRGQQRKTVEYLLARCKVLTNSEYLTMHNFGNFIGKGIQFGKETHEAFELGERRTEYKIYVISVVIGDLGGGIKEAILEVKKIFKKDDLSEKIVGEMERTVLMDSETVIRKILSGHVQTDFS